jgi:hypothetical protein
MNEQIEDSRPAATPETEQRGNPNSCQVSRRAFLHGVMALSTVTPVLAGAPLSAAGPGQTTGSTRTDSVSAVLNRLVPPNGGFPGAGDLGLADFVDQTLEAAPHLRDRLSRLLAQLPDKDTLGALPEPDAEQLLQQLESRHADAFDLLLQIVYVGYYGHPKIQEALVWVDPSEAGCRIQPFDPQQFEATRRRGCQLQALVREEVPQAFRGPL